MLKSAVLATLIFMAGANAFAQAANVPQPQGLYTVDQLFDEFRGAFRAKVEQLIKNYTAEQTRNQVVLKASSATPCMGQTIQPGDRVGRITFTFHNSGSELHETVTYYGCDQQPTLTESIVTRGTMLSPATWGQIILGQRSIQLKSNETYRSYSMVDANHTTVAAVVTQSDGQNVVTHFSSFSQPVLDMREDNGISRSYTVYNRATFSLDVRHGGNHLGWKLNPDPQQFLAVQYLNGQYVYKESDVANPVSLSQFQKQFAATTITYSIDALSSAIAIYLDDFPKTEFVGLGVRDSRVLTELTRVLNGLISGTDTNFIKALIKEYIDDIQKGLLVITDNRPTDRH